MPELPEVETIVRELSRRLPAAKITRVQIKHADIIGGTPAAFQRALRGRTIQQVERRAKNIVIRLDDGSTLVVNLGMTGRLVAAEAKRAGELTHVAVRFDLEDGRALLYDDVRRFGRLELFPPESWEPRAAEFGVEPLSDEFTAEKLLELTKQSISPIRNWLLDPYRVAGVGNIYANEALYRSGIRPTRRANTLTRSEVARLRDQIRQVLEESIRMRGTTMSDYVDATGEEGEFWDLRRAYGREGEPCSQCGTLIKRVVLSNRSAFYCPKCQR
jgi:formamidopyrimidine-DNA glycosylase